MKINEVSYNWNGSFANRTQTDYIILHHRAGDGDVQSIHSQHIKQGWAGIGYHFYVRKDGSVYRGRPLNAAGAHCAASCVNYNFVSVGVCFEGNFENETMSDLQLTAGIEIVEYLKEVYPDAEVKAHRDFMGTSCPGVNFPMDKMKSGITTKKLESANDITWELNHSHFEIQDTDKFVKELEEARKNNSSLYWGYYKLVNGKGEKQNG